MANENLGSKTDPQGGEGEGAKSADPKASGTDPQGAADVQGDPDDVLDKHGNPGISRGKYERDIKERDEEIAKLKEQIEKAAESKEAREALEKQIADLEASQKDKDTAYELQLAGCVDVKAAKARLEDFGGDIGKLKGECPYLFNKPQGGSLGFKPGGAPSMTKADIEKISDRDKRLEAIGKNMHLYEN